MFPFRLDQISVSRTSNFLTLNGSEQLERRFAAGFLTAVVLLQVLNALIFSIQSSKGKKGRLLYYFAFVSTVIHDLFVGLLVPISLLWVAYALFIRQRLKIEPLTTTIVGALWYGPERVQQAISNLLHLKKRYYLLKAALAAYHRTKSEYNEETGTWDIVRYERRLPLVHFNRRKMRNTPHSDTREVKARSALVRLALDRYLRSIGRMGVKMAISGEFTDNDMRDWYIYLVADQARFPLSPLETVEPSLLSMREHSGYGATRMKRCVKDIDSDWTEDQWRRLITVYEGMRHCGYSYLWREGWILH